MYEQFEQCKFNSGEKKTNFEKERRIKIYLKEHNQKCVMCLKDNAAAHTFVFVFFNFLILAFNIYVLFCKWNEFVTKDSLCNFLQ